MRFIVNLVSVCAASLFVFTGCVEPFELPESVSVVRPLVVEGHINMEQGEAVVKLSRTQNLNDASTPPPETNAQVNVESEKGERFMLWPQQDGYYRITGLDLIYGQQYRLRIKTRGGQEYLSAYVSTQRTPAIDSVTWNVEREGVQVKVNTHDSNNQTRYYRWEFEETYEYSAPLMAFWIYDETGRFRARRPDEMIFICWRTEFSNAIHLGTTVQLAQDVVEQFPLTFSHGRSPKLSRKYSILVKQYGISQEEFQYWQMLKKNTENVGSLFDAQPSQVLGNLSRVDSDTEEPVLGYFSVRSMASSRIFISAQELQPYNFGRDYIYCETGYITERELQQYGADYIVMKELGAGCSELEPGLLCYEVATKDCADCRAKGGVTVKPAFWE